VCNVYWVEGNVHVTFTTWSGRLLVPGKLLVGATRGTLGISRQPAPGGIEPAKVWEDRPHSTKKQAAISSEQAMSQQSAEIQSQTTVSSP
jgi:hypothetical protein